MKKCLSVFQKEWLGEMMWERERKGEGGWKRGKEGDTYMADKWIEAFCNAKPTVVLGSLLGTPLTATGGLE